MATESSASRSVAAAGVRRKFARARRSGRAVSTSDAGLHLRRSGRDWPERYAGRLRYSDLVVVVLTLVGFSVIVIPSAQTPVHWDDGPTIPYWVALLIFGIVWLLALSVFDTRERHIVGNGVLEYRRVVNATLAVFGLIVVLAFFLRAEVSRSLLLVALPLGLALLLLSRWLWRQWLRRQQRSLRYVYRALVVAEPRKAAHIIDSIKRSTGSGFDIVGVATTRWHSSTLAGVPVVGSVQDVVEGMDLVDADTVIVAEADELTPLALRRLGWDVAERDANLVMAPAVTDIAGPRIHTRPAAGLPLLHVEFPELEGSKRFMKRAFDIVASVALIILLSPVFLVASVAVMLDSKGPVIYRQARVGRRGTTFGMLKIRSMVANADDQLESLLDLQGRSSRPLFKVVNDPRITRVGRFLRRHSIDELPQLFNVLRGEMSLVGPRPQREAEVALYDEAAHRRLLVKPGMSGLWQVSGRSTLSWEETLRLDLYYVENWSFTQDLVILFRTFRAVLLPNDAAH